MRKVTLLLALVIFTLSCSEGKKHKASISDRVLELSSAEALDCGLSVNGANETNLCVIEAFDNRQPFYAEYFEYDIISTTAYFAYDGDKLSILRPSVTCDSQKKDCSKYYSERECINPVFIGQSSEERPYDYPFQCEEKV